MKVAVTASQPDLLSAIDQRFGRAKYLLIVTLPERTFEVVENRAAASAAQGAGIAAAQTVIDTKAEAVITGHCGPKAFQALQAAGIRVYVAGEGTVVDALDRLEKNERQELTAPDVSGHW